MGFLVKKSKGICSRDEITFPTESSCLLFYKRGLLVSCSNVGPRSCRSSILLGRKIKKEKKAYTYKYMWQVLPTSVLLYKYRHFVLACSIFYRESQILWLSGLSYGSRKKNYIEKKRKPGPHSIEKTPGRIEKTNPQKSGAFSMVWGFLCICGPKG